MFSRRGMYPKRVLNISHLDGYYPVSKSFVHFYSYERYKVLRTGTVDSSRQTMVPTHSCTHVEGADEWLTK
jgi:hypothetical protein